MRRREFVALLGGAMVGWPITALAQKNPIVIGFLGGQAQPLHGDPQGKAFRQGLLDYGLVEGRDYVIEDRFAGGDDTRIIEFAHEFARSKVRIIVANTPAGVRAAQHLDPPISVLMTVMNDPVGAGLVSSLAHPGNHTSGTASLNQDLTPKMLEFVREIVPKASTLAALFNPRNPTSPVMMENLRANGERTGMTVLPFKLAPRDDLDALFSALATRHLDAVQVISDPSINDTRYRLAELAVVHRIPLFSTSSLFAEAGSLISYGASVNKILRRMGYYVKKIIDGVEAGELPVEQPTELELIVNQKTATALGIQMPPTLVSLADEVID
jgi:putative tryptophan/tyrosine transport system substrate-binding protein